MIIILLTVAVASLMVVPSAEGLQPSCSVVPIDLWGGSPSGYVRELPRPVEWVVVTHTVTTGCYTDDACERLSRSIRNAHIQQGFEDVRLSFLIGGNGKIYEGAGWKVGSHTGSYSDKSISLSFIGDFSDSLPTEAALKAAERFLGCFINTRNLGCEYKLVGHRQLILTTSPGNALQKHIESWPHWSPYGQTSAN